MAHLIADTGIMNEEIWNCRKPATKRLTAFENAAYQMMNLMNVLLTLHDDLYGERSRKNQLEIFSTRMAGKEGPKTDAVFE